jgi:hypothetical protein
MESYIARGEDGPSPIPSTHMYEYMYSYSVLNDGDSMLRQR